MSELKWKTQAQREAALRAFAQKNEEILRSTELGQEVRKETKAQREARKAKLAKDYVAFIEYYFPNYATAKPAPFHKRIVKAVAKDPRFFGAAEMAREHAKSVTLGMMLPMWLIARDKVFGTKEFNAMLLVSATYDKAETLLGDIQAQLESNLRFQNDYNVKPAHGSWAEGEFTTRCGLFFKAIGAGQSPRGVRNEAARPDYVLVDDIDRDDQVVNDDRTDKVLSWIRKALLPAISLKTGRFILAGNRIHPKSVLAKFIDKTEGLWHIKVNALDKNGKPSWNYFTIKDLEKRRMEMGSIDFEAEYMNNPVVSGDVFKEEWLSYQKVNKTELKKLVEVIAYCDPSLKNSKTSDYKAVAVLGRYPDGRLLLIDVFCRQCSVQQMVDWHYDYYEQSLNWPIPLRFEMEATFAQDLLLTDFQDEGRKRGIQLPLSPDLSKKPNKEARIMAMQAIFENRFILFNEDLKDKADFRAAKDQLLGFSPHNRMADDFPDALEGAYKKLSLRALQYQQTANNPTTYYKRTRPKSF